MKLITIADTYRMQRPLEIYGGDITHHGTLNDVQEFIEFLGTLPHPHKIVTAGNDYFCLDKDYII